MAYQDGLPVTEDDDVSGGGRILIWANEASSENDDGQNAVAEINEP